MSFLPNPNWHNLNNSTLLRFLLLFACGWAIVQLIDYFYVAIAIFSTAGILAALLNYPVQWLSRYVPREVAITIVFLTAVVLCVLIIAALGLEIVQQGQGLIEQITNEVDLEEWLPIQEVLGNLNIERLLETVRTGLLSGLTLIQNIFSSLFTLIFLAVICLYMLVDGGKLWDNSLKLVPVQYRDRFALSFRHSFLGFIQGQILLMLFLSTTSFLVFRGLGVNYALFLALIMGLFDAIPGIGATLGVLVISLLILASQGWLLALKVIIACVILQQIQDNFIQPKVMGTALEISPVLLFLALFIGERIAGILGIFLAVPFAGFLAAWFRAEAKALDDQAAIEEE